MTLGNMRELGVRWLAAFCHNDACRHQALIDVSAYSDCTAVPWFQLLARCSKCGSTSTYGHWKERPPIPPRLRLES
jgi:hypothetical protein